MRKFVGIAAAVIVWAVASGIFLKRHWATVSGNVADPEVPAGLPSFAEQRVERHLVNAGDRLVVSAKAFSNTRFSVAGSYHGHECAVRESGVLIALGGNSSTVRVLYKPHPDAGTARAESECESNAEIFIPVDDWLDGIEAMFEDMPVMQGVKGQ